MIDNFGASAAYTLDRERGFSNHPEDHGGPTKYGVTQETLSKWRGAPQSAKDVEDLEENEALDIFHTWYWLPMGLSKLASPATATAIFDTGVLHGGFRAIAWAQQAADDLIIDGHMGPHTIAKLNGLKDAIFIRTYEGIIEDACRAIARRDPTQAVFLVGWLKRTQRLLTLIPN